MRFDEGILREVGNMVSFVWRDENGDEVEMEVSYTCLDCGGSGFVPFCISPDGYIVYNYCKICGGSGTIGSGVIYWLAYEGGRLQ